MNILLFNPFTGEILMSPPLGLRYISAMLKHHGFKNVVGVDLHVDTISKFESEVVKADVVGIHAVSKAFPQTVKLAEKAKKLNPKIKVVIGGPHASILPDEVVSAEAVDFAVIGDGEYTFLELIKALENDLDISDIKGIYYKSDGVIKRNPPRERTENLDELPFPDFELFDLSKYVPLRLVYRFYRSSTMIASRSCPYNCAMCQPALREIAGSYRQRSVENVISEVLYMRGKYKTHIFHFVDNTFTVNRQWVVDFCSEIIKRGLKVKWDCAGTISRVDEELMQLMKKAGCIGIGFGVESGSQCVLDYILTKRHTVARAREVIHAATAMNLRTLCWFMIGIPGETKEQMWETIELARTLDCTSLMFSVTVPQPHTALTNTCEEKGWVLPHQLTDLEKPGIYAFTSFKGDEWLGRSSLFKTAEWDPEYIEEVKQKIVDDFNKKGWSRDGFTFTNVARAAAQCFIEYVGKQSLAFLRDGEISHIKWIFKAIEFRGKSFLGIKK